MGQLSPPPLLFLLQHHQQQQRDSPGVQLVEQRSLLRKDATGSRGRRFFPPPSFSSDERGDNKCSRSWRRRRFNVTRSSRESHHEWMSCHTWFRRHSKMVMMNGHGPKLETNAIKSPRQQLQLEQQQQQIKNKLRRHRKVILSVCLAVCPCVWEYVPVTLFKMDEK